MGESVEDRLLAKGIITQAQLDSAKSMQQSIGGAIGPILSKLGFVTEAQLTAFMAEAEGLGSVSIADVELSGELMITFEREFLLNNQIVPIKRDGGTLTIAIADPTNVAAIENVRFLSGLNIATVLASRREIQETLNKFFYREDSRRMDRVPREHRDPHELAREIQVDGLQDVPAVGGPDGAEVLRFLVGLMVDNRLVTVEDLKQIIADLKRDGAEASE